MKQHHGKLVTGLAVLAFFGLAASAQAQPVGAPPAAPPPEMAAPAPPPPMAPAPVALGADNMSGQLGFGAGVAAGTTTLIAPGATINMKYWLSDVLSLMPQLQIKLSSAKGRDTAWAFSPDAMILYCPWKTTSTRLNVGGGLGFTIAKWPVTAANPVPNLGGPAGAPSPDTFIAIRVPVYAGVEHFFTRWFSMGIAVQDNFISFTKLGEAHEFDLSIDNTRNITGLGFLFFYTD